MLRELGALELLNESVADHMQEIERASLDAAYQIASLQQYIKYDKSSSFEPLNLSELVEDCIKLTYPYWHNEPRRHGINIHVEHSLADVPTILGSPTELRNVCVNLILNAVQAMPDGGLMRFVTRHDAEVGVQLTVTDAGIGMPDHVQRRIFEPLFTTKGDQGNGMGLAVSLGVVRVHDGDIHVDSAPGRGTTFTLTFPTAQTTVSVAPLSVVETAPRTAHILVVDDDPKVLNVLVRLLQTRGHEVESADSGREALAAAQRRPPDVVITDLGMPDMNGRQLAASLRNLYPSLPVILVTGDTDTGEEDDTIDAIINKPFKIKDLDSKIQSLICQEIA
jgi:CheY-like chemotaxis protein